MTQAKPLSAWGATIDEVLERAPVVALPMRVPFRGVTTREALLFRGPVGWGEFAPFSDYSPEESAYWLSSGLEMAYQGPPKAMRDCVEVNGTIPAVIPEQVPEVMAHFDGCRTFKVKVAEKGHSLSDDVARVNAVREAMPSAIIRVDANRGWSVEQAFCAAKQLSPLDYMEQPCATVAELIELRQRLIRAGLFVRVAADEAIRRAEDPYEVARAQAADVAVVKAAPLGGPRKLLQIAEFMRARGLDITVASALDTGVGMNAGLAAVAALPKHTDDEDFDVPPAAAGLATQRLFVEDITAPRQIVDGQLAVEMLSPDPDRLSEFSVKDSRRDAWLQRLQEAWEFLER
ncbi:o-succinylbenzoate synthase [Corynebacterium pseudotuberculosis]|uniref:o-succinylbenzoate synthase n=1 Tax=Corynebacterium pseudotuberculosis TaxID=1719 RepID=UPI0001DD4894|nr:o-succinylbenzoate synthase [Corynebacterium pseudotuberculosis]ADK28088.1 o-succinylbenzoate synthase [Corynebacterium pseudotuberculosis FRC41]ADL20201.1 o-succinylbenzoate synthase [Corynebacterium pseudotuberculosis 1002]AEX38772.1 O-succinylbenzoate synthase [Corynebacterium pseudotuberculosis 3/99-5]AIG06657.1 O-succinylbenzoate synthase [Corynebacterium pseudotuberculosis]AIG08760.1 O-succinylbenzoate synthase [Corynebacterium pseudotuberculosis]